MVTQPKKLNVPHNQTTIQPEWITPPTKFLNPLLPLKLLDKERELQKKTSKLEKELLLCLMKKKLLPELKENKTLLISLPDKNKLNLFLMLLKLLFQNLKPSLHTVLLKLSWNLPNLVLLTQLPLQLKLLLPLTVKPLTDVSDYQKNSKLISLNSLKMTQLLKFKLLLTLTILWLKLLPLEKPPNKN